MTDENTTNDDFHDDDDDGPNDSQPTEVQQVEVPTEPAFEESDAVPSEGSEGNLSMLYDLAMPVIIELGRTKMTVHDILKLGRGSVIQLERSAGEPIDVLVSNRKVAEGEVVVIREHFGIRITRIVGHSPMDSLPTA